MAKDCFVGVDGIWKPDMANKIWNIKLK